MDIIGIVLLVVFVLVCLIIIALVLLQNEEGGGLGGLFAGGSNSAFGSRSGNVLTKATYIVVTMFFVTAFFLAFLHKTPGDEGLQEAAVIEQAETKNDWYKADAAPVLEAPATSVDATAPLAAPTATPGVAPVATPAQ